MSSDAARRAALAARLSTARATTRRLIAGAATSALLSELVRVVNDLDEVEAVLADQNIGVGGLDSADRPLRLAERMLLFLEMPTDSPD